MPDAPSPPLHPTGYYWVRFALDQPWEIAFRTWGDTWIRCGTETIYESTAEIGRHLDPKEARKDADSIAAANLARQAAQLKPEPLPIPPPQEALTEGMCIQCGRNLELVTTGGYLCPVINCPNNLKWEL